MQWHQPQHKILRLLLGPLLRDIDSHDSQLERELLDTGCGAAPKHLYILACIHTALLLGFDPFSSDSQNLCFDSSGEPPGPNVRQAGSDDKRKTNGKTVLVAVVCPLLEKYLRPYHTTDLANGRLEREGKSGSSGSLKCCGSP